MDIIIGATAIANLCEDVPREIAWDEFSIASGTCHYTTMFANATELVGDQKVHPDFDFMIRKTALVRRIEAGICQAQINVYGVEENTAEHRYFFSASAQTQPIETHPRFKSDLGGYGTETEEINTKNNAKFDKQGRFIGFIALKTGTPKQLEDNEELVGVRSYYAAGVTLESHSVLGESHANLDLSRVGFTEEPPPIAIDNVNIDEFNSTYTRSWIASGVESAPVGKGFRRVYKWLLSGHRGWVKRIYGNATGITLDTTEL